MILGENENNYLIDFKEYKQLLKKVGILDISNYKLRSWITNGQISGFYQKYEKTAGVYVDKTTYDKLTLAIGCDKCVYKDRLNIISDIVNIHNNRRKTNEKRIQNVSN